MFKNILVAYDGSNPADNAFEYARRFGKQFGATIDVISIVRQPLIASEVESTTEINQEIRVEQAILRLRRRAHGKREARFTS